MCVKVIANQRWDVFLRHVVVPGLLVLSPSLSQLLQIRLIFA